MAKDAPLPNHSATPPSPNTAVGRTESGTRAAVRPPSHSARPRPSDVARALDAAKETNPMGRGELRLLMKQCAEDEQRKKEEAARLDEEAKAAPEVEIAGFVDLVPLVDDADAHVAETLFFATPPAEAGHDFAEVDALLDASPQVDAPVVEAPRHGFLMRRLVALALLGVLLVVVHADAAQARGAVPLADIAAR